MISQTVYTYKAKTKRIQGSFGVVTVLEINTPDRRNKEMVCLINPLDYIHVPLEKRKENTKP